MSDDAIADAADADAASPIRIALGRALVSGLLVGIAVVASAVIFLSTRPPLPPNATPPPVVARVILAGVFSVLAGVTMTLPTLAAEHLASRWRKPTIASDVGLGLVVFLAAGLGLGFGFVQAVYGAYVFENRSLEAGLAGVRKLAELPAHVQRELVLQGVAVVLPFVPLVLVRRRGGGLTFQSGAVVAVTGAAAAVGVLSGLASGPDAIVLGVLVLASAALPVIWEVPAALERRLLRRR